MLTAVERQVACRIAGAFLLLVARVVFLVDHDQAQLRDRGQHRHARAQHDAGPAAVCGQPAFEALRRCERAVHGHHGLLSKALPHPGFELGREVDLGHHDQGLRLRIGLQRLLHGAQVHLGLAAAGVAKQEEGAGVTVDLLQSLGLLGRRLGPLAEGHRLGCGQFFQAPRQPRVVEVAQLRGQCAERHLAQAALVILGGKRHQLAPVRIERREPVKTGRHFPRRCGFQSRIGGVHAPDHAQHFTLAQGHPHELARLQGQRAAVAQQIAHATVGGGLHSHFDPMGRGSVHGALRRVSRLINFLEIDDKSLIFQCFVRCSDFLWITLLKTRGDARQTLENQAFRHNAHLLSRN